MLKALAHFFFFLLLLSPLVSFAAEQETLPPGTLTVQKYTEFLCATAATDSYSLYNEKMGGDLLSPCIIREGEPGSYSYQAIPEHADDPVPYVSRLSAKRYCNWLQNGKLEGEQDETTTERGAYTLEGMMDEDPEREEGATYFLPASTNNEVDPTLASNLKTYVITTHLGDSFRFSNSSSQDETAAWTVEGVIGGIVGVAGIITAVLHCRGGMMHEEESSDDHYVDSADRTEQARRQEDIAKMPTKPPLSVSFNKRVTLCEGAGKTTFLSDKPSTLNPTGRLEDNDPRRHQWGHRLREDILPSLSRKWLEENPGNSFFITLHNKLLDPKRAMTWDSQEAWHAWRDEVKKSSAFIQEVIKKKTDLLDDWENWREHSYGTQPRSLNVLQKEAADIWSAQIEATLDELNELSQTAEKIRAGDHEITSAAPLNQTFEILFQTTFSHLHRISTHIEDAPSATLEPLFVKESEIKTFLDTWHGHLEQNLHGLNFVPYLFESQIKTVIAATQTLADLVDQHQDQALRLRQIVEEER